MGIRFTSQRYSGSFTRNVRVTSNDPKQPTVTVSCMGTVFVPFRLDQNRVAFAKTKNTEGPVYRTVTITRGESGPIHPTVLPHKHMGLDAQICEIEPGEVYELEISMDHPWPNGYFRYPLRINPGIPDMPSDTVYVLGTIVKRLATIPERFTVPFKRSRDSLHSIRLRWTDNKPGKVLGVETSIEGASVELLDRGPMQMVRLTVPQDAEVTSKDTVTLKTDDPGVPTYEIPISVRKPRATRARAARARAAPTTGVSALSRARKPVRVKNTAAVKRSSGSK